MQMPIQRWLQESNYFKILAGVATLVVVYLSLKPPGPDEQPWNLFFIRGDLILHFTCYFGLSILYVFAFFKHRATYKKALISSVLVGTLLELLQLIPSFQRYFDYQDLIANFLGAAIGIFSFWFLFRYSTEE